MGYDDHPHPLAKDLRGKRFGRLAVKELAAINPRAWLVVCDCGVEKIVASSNLISGRTLSCGCLWRDNPGGRSLRHGHDRKGKTTKTYRAWVSMWTRCGDSPRFVARYRDRGITVAPRWSEFENFLADMGESPPGRSLDRIDNDGLRSEAILARINSGWSAEDALTRQVRHTDFVPKAVA